MDTLKRVLAGCVVGSVFVVVVCCGSAGAAMPWWHVNTVSAPAAETGGPGRLVVEVSNLGDAPVNGFTSPVTIVDALPAGVVATHVYGEGGGSEPVGVDGVKEVMKCEIDKANSQLVRCTYAGPLLAYERFMIAITVETQPGAGTGSNEVSVTGGEAAAVTSRHHLALTDVPSGFGVENYELTPEEEGGGVDTLAGSHPFQFTSTLTLNSLATQVFDYFHNEVLPEVQPVALPKDLNFVLPAGLVGNPTPLPKCNLAVFMKQSSSAHCPDDATVGVATAILTSPGLGPYVPFGRTFPLYGIEPDVGEPARFGFETPVGPVVIDTSVRNVGADGGYMVVASVDDIPDYLGFIGSQVTFWGVPADSRHDTSRGSCLDEYEGTVQKPKTWEFACPVQEKPQPFLIMPTSCLGPLHSSVEGDPWSEIGNFTSPKEYVFAAADGEPATQAGCNQLSFDPSISVTPDSQDGSTPTGLTVGIHVDQEASLNPAGRAESSVRDTTVALPAGIGLNPAGADGLSACAPNQIALGSETEQACPESSKVGTVEVRTPLLSNPLTGAAYIATQNANPFGSLLALYLVVYDPVSGVRVKLAGEVKANSETGQLVSTFNETPQLPFEDLNVHFFGGSRAPLGTPALCGQYTTNASIAPWSGNPAAQVSSDFQITSGPNGTPCSNPLRFAPALTAGSSNIQAGAFTPFTMTMSREDGNQNLKAIQLKLPPGLLGSLSGVKLCEEARANAGTCGPESLIGHTTVSVGLGGNPYTVRGGEVFMTGPYDGAPYGLSIVNPAKAGPFDLGKVIVRAKVEVNPLTVALTITSDTSGPYAIPQFIDGIPLQIKHVNVTVDRGSFTFNPTSCAPKSVDGYLQSSQGATSNLSVPFQVTNCATLGFKPHFAATTIAKTSRAIGARLHVKLTYPKAPFGSQANVREAKVDLPKQLPARLTTLQQACPNTTFERNPAACSSRSRVGEVKATTPVLPVPLSGPAYFVSYGGQKFPELVMVLSGYGTTAQLHAETYIDQKTGVTSSTLHTVPDVPVGMFELTLPQGRYSALAAPHGVCNVKLKMPTAFTAENGLVVKETIPIAVTGCAKHSKPRRKPKHKH